MGTTRTILAGGALALTGGSLGAAVVVPPEAVVAGFPLGPPCPYRLRTGTPCPTCGMTRAFCALGHGDYAAAVAHHPASPLAFAVCLAMAVAAAVVLVRGLRSSPKVPDRASSAPAAAP